MWTTKKVKAYRVLTDWQNNKKLNRQIDGQIFGIKSEILKEAILNL